jgi:hypothetical protein
MPDTDGWWRRQAVFCKRHPELAGDELDQGKDT